MSDFTKEQIEEIIANAEATKAKLEAETHEIVDAELVEK